MSATTPKTSGETAAAKFAVVRLKPGDNLLELFQLLIHNGFGEVSFVNNLSETIFPALGAGNRAPSPALATVPKKDEMANQLVSEKSSQQNLGGSNQVDLARSGPGHGRLSISTNEYYQLPMRVFEVESVIASKSSLDNAVLSDELSANPAKRSAIDVNAQSQVASTAPVSAQAALPAFATMPSSFLGLPTMPSLNTSAAAAAAIAALSEAATPPYSFANFFTPNGLPTTVPSGSLVPPPANGTVPQYSPALLAAAAMAQQRQAPVPRPRSPPTQIMASPVSHLTRPQLSTQPQPRVHATQSYQFQQHPFQLITTQPKLAFSQPQPQATKPIQQKSPPAASPASSTSSSNHSGHQSRITDGTFSANCAPMPPGCATTQLRQRGQRSYAEDPSLYVACRLCKNKIMGSRISNLTNHVRRHSSMKQFQCCYCDYTHNEMAKVRLHMLHNHKDKDSQPIDNLSPEMQASWDLLMKECFPDHCQQQQSQTQHVPATGSPPQQHTQTGLTNNTVASLISKHLQLQCQGPTASAVSHLRGELSLQQITYNPNRRSETGSNGSAEAVSPPDASLSVLVRQRETENPSNGSPTSSRSTSSVAGAGSSLSPETTTPPANQPQLQQHLVARCAECGLYVNARLKARHIRKCHLQLVLPFVCSMCGYDHSEHSKVKVHICLKHDDDPTAQVVTRDISTYAEQLVPEYFPTSNELQYPTNNQPALSESSELVASSTNDNACYATNQATLAEVYVSQQPTFDSVIVCARPISSSRRTVGQTSCSNSIQCRMCKRGIRRAKAIRHAQKHLSAAQLAYICSVCAKYRTGCRMRMRRHMETKHSVNGNTAQPFMFRRTGKAVASNSGTTQRALRRCFPASHTFEPIRKHAQTVVRRYRKPILKKSKCLRRRNRKPDDAQTRRCRMRNSVSIKHSQVQPSARTISDGLGRSSNATRENCPATKTAAPKIDPEAALELMVPAPTDLLRMCPLCTHWIRSDMLTAHLQSHVPAMGASYRCNLCDYTAPDALLIRAHFVQDHQKAQMQQQQVQHEASHRQASLFKAYANLCRSSSNTATAADG